MSSDKDKIDNFQRNVLLARAKVEKAEKSDKIRSKKLSSNIQDSEHSSKAIWKVQSSQNSLETISKKKSPVMMAHDQPNYVQKDVPPIEKTSDKENNDADCLSRGKSSHHVSHAEKVSPSCKAPEQKKRKRTNFLAHSDDNGNMATTGKDSSAKQSSNYIQELQELSAQLHSEPQSCTLSPIQSKMTYGESRYQKPQQVKTEHSNISSFFIPSFANLKQFIPPEEKMGCNTLPQLLPHDYPPGLEPPGLEPPKLAPDPASFDYPKQPIDLQEDEFNHESQRNLLLHRKGVNDHFSHFESESVANSPQTIFSSHGYIAESPSTTSYLTSFDVEPCRESNQESQRKVPSNRSAVSHYLDYFEPESASFPPNATFSKDGYTAVGQSTKSDSMSRNRSQNFIGKHPSLVRKPFHGKPKIESFAHMNETDSDGEVRAILMEGGHNNMEYSPVKAPDDSNRFSGGGSNNRTQQKLQSIPTFTQLDSKPQNKSIIPSFSQLNNSSDRQYQTPPGSQSSSRVQDGRWSLGSVDSASGSGAASPSGRVGRHSSPSSRNRYTGKPRSSNSSPITREVKISKALSGICRHKHGSEDLMMLEGGYFSVEEILNTSRFKQMSVTRSEIEDIVKNNDKQRFSLKEYEGNLLICANQGHSFEVKGLELERIHSAEGYSGVVHGTYDEAWESIRSQGLSRMNRTHIHFAVGLPSNRQVISGMRGDCQVAIYIDMKSAIRDGFEFFRSRNNVILCSGDDRGFLPTKYFNSVIRLKGQRQLLHETKPVVPVVPLEEQNPSDNQYNSPSAQYDIPNNSHSAQYNKPSKSYSSALSEADRSSNWRKR